MRPITEAQFHDRYTPEPNTGCWLWTRHLTDRGYGAQKYRMREWRAHRLMWLFTHGGLTDEQQVLHTCDTRSCVNPDHLFLGTVADNMEDRRRKGRNLLFSGENCGNHLLNEVQVREIRQRYAGGCATKSALSRSYGVSVRAVADLLSGRTWKHTE